MKEIKNVSIIGMGALGVMYGSHLAHHMGFDHVTYIMDEKRYEKYKGSTVTCNGEELSFTCVPASQAVPADLVIVAVKSTGLTEALDTMKNCIGPDTVILSVMNGISSEEIIGERQSRAYDLCCSSGHGCHEIRCRTYLFQDGCSLYRCPPGKSAGRS